MALLSIFRGTQAECSARPVSDGTLLFATDTKNIYLDKDSSRIEMSSVDDLGNYVTKEQLTTALSGKANSSHTHTKSQITDFPSSLKNPNSLTISLNGTSQGAYDGSAAKSINVTPASIGAAASSHNHSAANITSGTLSTDRLPTVPIGRGGTGANSASAAFKNLSGYTLDIGTNNTIDTWVPVFTNSSTIQHRVLPTLPFPVSAGGTGANTASAARSNLLAAELISGDFNAYTATGIYQYQGGSKDNRPTDNWGVLIVSRSIVGNVVRISQVYYADRNNDVFLRTATDTSLDALTWTGWSRLVRTDEMAPVYRLYNSYDKMFLFTVSTSEYNDLVSKGWTGNGIAFYAFK